MYAGIYWPDSVGLGLSFGFLAYAHLTRASSGESVTRYAAVHRQELLCALALMFTWKIVSYQTDPSDSTAWTLVVGAIGFWMGTSVRRSRKWGLSACAAGLLIITAISGLLGPTSLLGKLAANNSVPTIDFLNDALFPPSVSAANWFVACQQLCIAASFMFLAAILALKYRRYKPGDLVTLFRWMAVTVGIAIAEPLLAAAQGLPAMIGGVQLGRVLLADFDPVGMYMWALTLTGGIVLMLLFSLSPRGIGPVARETICVAALLVAATAAYEPSVVVSQNSFLSGLIVGPFTGANDLISTAYLGLVLMTTLWLASMVAGRWTFLAVVNFVLDVVIYVICSMLFGGALVWYRIFRLQVVFGSRPPIFNVVLGTIEPFGSAALTITLAFALLVLLRLSGRHIESVRQIATVQGARLRSRFSTTSGSLVRPFSWVTTACDFLSFGQFSRAPLRCFGFFCIGAFFVSLECAVPSGLLFADGLSVPMRVISWSGLLDGFVSLLAALVLWRLVQVRYEGYVNYLAPTVGALGLFILDDSSLILLALLMAILGGPLESWRRTFQRPSKRSLGFALSLGITSLLFFWAFVGLDAEVSAPLAVIPAAMAAVIHPVSAERLPTSVFRRNQIRLRQMIYWLTALAFPFLFLDFDMSPVALRLGGAGWQGATAADMLLLLSLLLLGAAGCGWIASGWWAAAAFAASNVLRWRPPPEEAYGRYYGTAREVSGGSQPHEISAGTLADGENLLPAGQDPMPRV